MVWSRLIPAHAGKTTYRRTGSRLMPAHPRSRGENGIAVQDAVGKFGSSPLTRGKPRGRYPLVRRVGLIPAHAGKTSVS